MPVLFLVLNEFLYCFYYGNHLIISINHYPSSLSLYFMIFYTRLSVSLFHNNLFSCDACPVSGIQRSLLDLLCQPSYIYQYPSSLSLQFIIFYVSLSVSLYHNSLFSCDACPVSGNKRVLLLKPSYNNQYPSSLSLVFIIFYVSVSLFNNYLFQLRCLSCSWCSTQPTGSPMAAISCSPQTRLFPSKGLMNI